MEPKPKGQEVFWVPLREPALHVFFIWPVGGDVKMGRGNTILTEVRISREVKMYQIFTNYSAFILQKIAKLIKLGELLP